MRKSTWRFHRSSASRHSAIARAAFAAPDDAGLASGRRARVARAPRVDEGDAHTGAQERERGPAAEGAGTDDGYMLADAARGRGISPGGQCGGPIPLWC